MREVLKGTLAADTLVFMGGLDDRDSFRAEDEDEALSGELFDGSGSAGGSWSDDSGGDDPD